MRTRSTYEERELAAIRSLLEELRRSPRERQKVLRGRLRRKHRFFISDFERPGSGFRPEDLDRLVSEGTIRMRSSRGAPAAEVEQGGVK